MSCIPGTDLPMLKLLPVTSANIRSVWSWISDKRASAWLDFGGGRRELPERELFMLLTSRRNYARIFTVPDDDRPLGLVCLNDADNLMGSADVWGVRGVYARAPHNVSIAAFLLMLATGFVDLDRKVIGSWIVDGNEFSISMHRRLGLKQMGRARARHQVQGVQRDRLLFDITREEFAATFPQVPGVSGRTLGMEAPLHA